MATATATQMAQTLRGLSPSVCQDFNGGSIYSRSTVPLMNLRSPRVRHGVSLASSSCQLLQGSQFLKLQASHPRAWKRRRFSVAVRCEQSTEEGNSLNTWLGRVAMLGFASAITVEITTGKGLLQNIGLITPLPTVALALTVVIGLLTAYFIFESGSKD